MKGIHIQSHLILFAVLVFLFLLQLRPAETHAQELQFSADYFGDPVKPELQSLNQWSTWFLANEGSFESFARIPVENRFFNVGRAIGMLDVLIRTKEKMINETCTASLIDTNKIITCYHCLHHQGNSGKVVQAKLHLNYLSMAIANQSETPFKTFDINPIPLEENKKYDYAILEVKGNPGINNYIPMKVRELKKSEDLFIIHHPLAKPKKLTRSGCYTSIIEPKNSELIYHICWTLPGSSGALIFGGTDQAIVGLHHRGGYNSRDDTYNRAYKIQALLNQSSILRNLAFYEQKWSAVKDSKDDKAINDFISAFPESPQVFEAKYRLKKVQLSFSYDIDNFVLFINSLEIHSSYLSKLSLSPGNYSFRVVKQGYEEAIKDYHLEPFSYVLKMKSAGAKSLKIQLIRKSELD